MGYDPGAADPIGGPLPLLGPPARAQQRGTTVVNRIAGTVPALPWRLRRAAACLILGRP
ncbi:hypothetical protein [Nocardioides solisilvae]|uniref:hypothetical protein n=1 Tax=Nocardioides solisilvae TaxID=1542435 RepID=UPI0013A58527|nr:hypothetical protein [Nocardioides solisilvae]